MYYDGSYLLVEKPITREIKTSNLLQKYKNVLTNLFNYFVHTKPLAEIKLANFTGSRHQLHVHVYIGRVFVCLFGGV